MAQEITYNESEYIGLSTQSARLLEAIKAGQVGEGDLPQAMEMLRRAQATMKAMETDRDRYRFRLGSEATGVFAGIATGAMEMLKGATQLPGEVSRAAFATTLSIPAVEAIDRELAPLEEEAQKLRVSMMPASAGPSLIGAGGGIGYRTYTPPAEATEIQRARLAELEKQIQPLRMRRNQIVEEYYQGVTKAMGAPQPLEGISRGLGQLREVYEGTLDPKTTQSVGYQIGSGGGQVLAGAATGPLALAALGASAAGSGMERARLQGATPGEAVTYGLGTGFVEAATERFALPGRVGQYFKGAIRPGGVGRTAVREAVPEFFQEQLSYYGTTGLEKATFNPDAEFDFVEGLKQGAYGAGTGGLVGGALGKLFTPAPGGKDTLYTEADKRAAQRMRESAANKNSPLQEDDANAREAFDEFQQRRISDYESMRQADPELPGVSPQSVSRGRAETQQEFFLEGLADTLGTKIVWVNEPGEVSGQSGIGAYHRNKNIIFLVKGGADMATQTKAVLMHELIHRRAAATGTDADIYDTIKGIDPEGLASVEALTPEARADTEEASAYYAESISKWLDASLNDRNFDRTLVQDNDLLDWAHDAAVGLYNKLSGSNLLTAEQKRINGALEEMGIESSTTISALDARKKAKAARALVDLLRELTDVGQYQAKRQAPELVQMINDTQAKIEQFQQENPGMEAPSEYYDTLEKAVAALETLAIDRKGVRDIKAQVGASFEGRRQRKVESYQREVAALENEIADLSRNNPDAPISAAYAEVVEELSKLSQASGGPALKLSDVAQQIIKQQAVKARESSLIDEVQTLDEQIIEAMSQRKPGQGIPKDLFNQRRAAVKLAGGEDKYPGMSLDEIRREVKNRKANAAKPATVPSTQEATAPAQATVAPQAPDYLTAAERFEEQERQRREAPGYTEEDVQRIRERNRELLAEQGLTPGVVEREAPAQEPARQVVNRAEQRRAEIENLLVEVSSLEVEEAKLKALDARVLNADKRQQQEHRRKWVALKAKIQEIAKSPVLQSLAEEQRIKDAKRGDLTAGEAADILRKAIRRPNPTDQEEASARLERAAAERGYQGPVISEGSSEGGIKFSRTRPSAAIGFAGGGTVSVALADKIDPQLAVEYSPEIAAVYNENSSTQALVESMENVDIGLFEGKEFAQFSPPCVASSAITGGRAVDRETETRLGKRVGEIIRKARNPVVVIENVPAYRGTEAFKAITEALNETGYTWDAHTYKAEEYGSPSKRTRMIVRAVLDGNLPPKPTPTHSSKPTGNQKPLVSWKSALGSMMNELPVEKGPLPSFIARSLEAKGIDPQAPGADYYIGGSQLYKWVPISPETEPSSTVMASHAEVPRILTKDGTVLRVTPEALKRLMGFGDELRLPADKNLAKRIIGNGVPKQLTQAVVGPLLDRESGKMSPPQGQGEFQFSRTTPGRRPRSPELQEAAGKRIERKISAEEYESAVQKALPIEPILNAKPETMERIREGLDKNKRELAGAASKNLKRGDPVQLRLDIPSWNKAGVRTITVHNRKGNSFRAGSVAGYEAVAAATLDSSSQVMGFAPGFAEQVATGVASKDSIGTINGTWDPITEEEAMRIYEESKKPGSNWTQVGMDPERHAYAFDRYTKDPVVSGTRVVQIGNVVLVENPIHADKEDFKFSRTQPSKSGDAEYMAAVERGGMAAAQRMVDEAAKAAGYNVSGLFHGTPRQVVTEISPEAGIEIPGAAFLTDNQDMADEYVYPREYGEAVTFDADGNEIDPGVVVEVVIRAQNPLVYDMNGRVGDAIEMSKVIKDAKSRGHDSVRFDNVRDGLAESSNIGTTWAIFDASQVKSADPVTYDEQGNAIPLSQRFDSTNKDIRFSKTPFRSPDPNEQSQEIVKQNAARLRSVGIPGRLANYLFSKARSTSLQGTFSWAFARALVNKQARQYELGREAQRLTIAGERVMPVDKTLEDVLATAPGRMAQHLRFLFKEEFSKIGEEMQRGQIMVDGNSVGRPSIGRFFQALGQPYRKQAQRDREIAEMVANGISQEDAERDFDEYRREHIKELEAQLAAAKDELEIESLKKSISQIRDGKAFMSDEDAAALVEEALNGPAGEQYKAIMDSVERINDYTLGVVEDTGLRSAAWVKTMRERYGPHYVPFKDFPDGMTSMAGHGDRIPAKIFHQYRGRETEASGVMEHLFSQASSVMHYAELNRSRNALFETLQGAEEVAETKRQFGETEKTPGVISPTITDSKEVTKFFSTDTEEFAGKPISVVRKAADDYATKNKTEKILFYRDGRPMWMVTKDVMLAKEIADADLITVGKIQKILSMITRWRSAVLTRYVPDFLVANPFRDILGLKIGLSLEYGDKFVSEHITFRKQVWAASILRKDPSQLTEEEARLLEEFRSSGAKMDWQMDKSFEQIARELNQMARAQKSLSTNRFVRSVVDKAEIAGDLSENATRFMVFAGMRRSGASKMRAAGAARRGTIDFTQRGTLAPWLNSMYVFMSVNMTSISRLIGLSLNPTATDVKTGKVLGAAGASAAKKLAMGVMPRLAVYGYIGALLADLMGGEDEETKMSNYSMIAPYQRTDFINIGTGSPSFVTIPAPHGFRFFSGVGALVYNVQKGYITEQEFRSEVMRSLFSAFSPVAGSTPLQAVTPDVVKPIIESVENKNWRGSQVHPVRPPGVKEEFSPSAYQAYERTPQHYRDIAETLNEASGGTRAKAGTLDMFPSTAEAYGDFFLGSVLRTLERIGKVATKAADPEAKFGEDYTVDDLPLLRVFVKTVNREEWARRTYQARSKETQQALADEREAVKMEAASRANLLKERKTGVPERINAANEAYAEDLKEARELYVARRGEREKKDFPLGGQMFTRAEAYKEFENRIEDLYDELKATSSLSEQKRIRREISRLKTVFSVQMMRLNSAN